jgi:hypothetical protein
MSILITAMYPLKSMAEISFRSPDSEENQISNLILFHALLPELRIWRCVAPGSMAKIPSGLRALGKSKLKSLFFPFSFLPEP